MDEKELLLRDLYYSPRTGFRSAKHLYELAKEEDPDISIDFVKHWLETQDSYTKNKKYSNPFHFRHTFVRDLAEQVQVDLIILQKYKDENNGYQYILMAIEILSRQGFAVPLKKKDSTETLRGMKEFLDLFKNRFYTLPKLMQFDEGGEFINKSMKNFLDSNDIIFFTTASKRKATVVERLNRTVKEKLTKLFEKNGNHVWYKLLNDIIYNYNTQVNRDIGESPLNVTEENKYIIWGRLFGHIAEFRKPKFNVGQKVRVLHFIPSLKGSKYQEHYRKTHERKINPKTGKPTREVALGAKDKSPFSNEIFEIHEVLLGDPVVYKLYSPEASVEILGKFYESELSLVRSPR